MFGEYKFEKYQPPLKPELNGGLYTGEPFKGPWGNVPIVPDTVHMITTNLKSANPPTDALFQYGNSIRPGNNQHNVQTGHQLSKEHNIVCTGKNKEKLTVHSFDKMNQTSFYIL